MSADVLAAKRSELLRFKNVESSLHAADAAAPFSLRSSEARRKWSVCAQECDRQSRNCQNNCIRTRLLRGKCSSQTFLPRSHAMIFWNALPPTALSRQVACVINKSEQGVVPGDSELSKRRSALCLLLLPLTFLMATKLRSQNRGAPRQKLPRRAKRRLPHCRNCLPPRGNGWTRRSQKCPPTKKSANCFSLRITGHSLRQILRHTSKCCTT